MFNKPFVVLDLETSGTDPKKDDIIEVAMVRYENGKEVDRYESLIRIDYSLSKIISIITGITDNDLQERGKDREVVFKKIESMLSGAYLVAHNTKFDAGFLEAKKIKMKVLGFLDTIPLAQIMIPSAASYSLESLSDDLNITHVNKHRAMGDVEATLSLFLHLCESIEQLPMQALKEIQSHCEGSTWEGAAVFADLQSTSPKAMVPNAEALSIQSSSNGIRKALEVDEILKEGGILHQFWDDYEPRLQQEEMSRAVLDAFEREYHLICEAPTGVGKSLAYLIPAAAMAIRNKSKVVISTNTINLQEQLYEKDIPLLKRIYHHGIQNDGVRAALLKGRNHYLCLRRLAKFKSKRQFSDDEIVLLIKILVWQATSVSGDSGEIHLTRNDKLIWDFELCADKKYCSPQKCKPYGDCYLHRARKKAEEADIVIVNHALLCADLESGGGLLPEYNYLVIDEAHNFEESATDAFGMNLKQENFSLPLKVVRDFLEAFKRQYQDTLFSSQMSGEQSNQLLEGMEDLQSSVDNLFTLIAYFVNRHVKDTGYVENLLIDQVLMGMEEWLNLSVTADEVLTKLQIWLKDLRSFADLLLLNGNEHSEQNEMAMEILQESELIQDQVSAMKHFFTDNVASDYIRWMSADLQGVVSINLAPYRPGVMLKNLLYNQKKSIILTSATLGVRLQQRGYDAPEQHPFTYLRTLLDLDEKFEELIIDSPFDFEAQTFVLVPTDALPISSLKSVQQLAPFFADLIKKVGGSMMTLFTSYRMIETLYMDLMEPLKNEGVKLLAQRLSGGRNKIMKAYMNDPAHSVLFGTSSFWEGVDIKGDALSTLVIHKLPFDVPTDPVCKARGQLFNNGFYEYSVPRAILKFRQGFGRLIRSKKDYGVMVVLDNRVIEKDYGKLFLEALPENVTLERMKLAEIPDQVKQWLDLNR